MPCFVFPACIQIVLLAVLSKSRRLSMCIQHIYIYMYDHDSVALQDIEDRSAHVRHNCPSVRFLLLSLDFMLSHGKSGIPILSDLHHGQTN